MVGGARWMGLVVEVVVMEVEARSTRLDALLASPRRPPLPLIIRKPMRGGLEILAAVAPIVAPTLFHLNSPPPSNIAISAANHPCTQRHHFRPQ